MIDVVVHSLRAVARDVIAIGLRDARGGKLPSATAGAHIDLALPNGLVRQYSLVNACGAEQQDSYELAVGWDANSRGGSRWVHEQLRVGQALRASAPRNLFEMEAAHRKVLLIAGGIGITPILAMARRCVALGLDWSVVACARSASRLAYLEELKALAGERLTTHFDDERGGPIHLGPLLSHARWDGAYACGPAPMLDAFVAATAHWPCGTARLERFKAQEQFADTRRTFELVLARTGCSSTVLPAESVLDVLERLGIEHPFACREGLCGTCEVPILEGEAEHLDSVLDPGQRAAQDRMIACVSRCAGERLVLDL